jgi:hypothetical protein
MARGDIVKEVLYVVGDNDQLVRAGGKKKKQGRQTEGKQRPLYDPSSSLRLTMREISP